MSRELEGKDKYAVLDCDVVAGVMSMLDALVETPRGKVVYQQVEHALRDLISSQNKIAYGYAHILNLILESYRRHLPQDSLLYLELKLVQKRLMPPISLNELAILHGYIKNVTSMTDEVFEIDEQIIRDAMLPLTGMVEEVDQQKVDSTETPTLDKIQTTDEKEKQQTASDVAASVELHVDSVFRQRLSKHYHEIQSLQESLSEKIRNTYDQYEEFADHLEASMQKLNDDDEGQSLKEIKKDLIHNIRSLLSRQIDFKLMLGDTQSYLSLINENSEKLSKELDQVRVLSLTDDLTGIPNRRAFLRRAEDEIGRADRDKTLLSMITIDLDFFKNINDEYGHTVGDEILKMYTQDVLSIFRRYDMVARYGGEEFAVLLPNTDQNGAMRALNKIQDKVSVTSYEHEGEVIPLPTFSAGLVIHRPGETVEDFIDRADKVLYEAKQKGRNRVEIDTSYLGYTHHPDADDINDEQG